MIPSCLSQKFGWLQASIIDILLKGFFKYCLFMYSLREVLDKVAKKEISPSEAEKLLKLLAVDEVGCLAKLDGNRELRKGIPEIILAEGKTASDVAEISRRMLAKNGRVIVSRCSKEQVQAIRETFSSDVYCGN